MEGQLQSYPRYAGVTGEYMRCYLSLFLPSLGKVLAREGSGDECPLWQSRLGVAYRK